MVAAIAAFASTTANTQTPRSSTWDQVLLGANMELLALSASLFSRIILPLLPDCLPVLASLFHGLTTTGPRTGPMPPLHFHYSFRPSVLTDPASIVGRLNRYLRSLYLDRLQSSYPPAAFTWPSRSASDSACHLAVLQTFVAARSRRLEEWEHAG